MWKAFIVRRRIARLKRHKIWLDQACAKRKAEIDYYADDDEDLSEDYALHLGRYYDARRKADDQISHLRTAHLLVIAERLMIPAPVDSPTERVWEGDYEFRTKKHLSDKALYALTKTIDAHRKDRADRVRGWIALLTGIIGTATGVTALFLHHGGH